MTAHDDLDRQLAALLEDGPTELPLDSFTAIRDRTDRTRQRVVLGPWRSSPVNKIVPVAVGAAAVVAVLVVGAQVLQPSGPTGVGGQSVPTPTTAPTATPDATPTPAATPTPPATPTATPVGGLAPMPAVGPVAAGTYAMTDGVSTIRVTVPDGWVAEEGGRLLRKAGDPGSPQFNLFLPDINVFADACLHDGEPDATGPTAEDLVAAVQAQAGTDASATAPFDIDGGTGVRLSVTIPVGFDFAACPDQGAKVWQAKGGGNYLAFGADGPGASASISIVTAPTGRIAYAINTMPATRVAVRTELDSIVNSIAVLPAP
jgi:hypothetical protein